MSFIQIIEYETNQAAQIDAAMRESMTRNAPQPGLSRLEQTKDHDNPNRYMTIVEFDSYAAAMANNDRPETQQMAAQLAAMCTSGPNYHNLDVTMQMP
jgi:quinol monooxygenase YgiN